MPQIFEKSRAWSCQGGSACGVPEGESGEKDRAEKGAVSAEMSEDRFNTTGWDREEVRRRTEHRQAEHRTSGTGNGNRRRKKRGSRATSVLLYLVFVVVASFVVAGVGWLLANDLCALNKEYKEATIEVTQDDDMGSVTKKLKEAGLIEYKWFFRLFCAVADAEEKIGEGTYTLNTNMDYRALITGMVSKSGGNMTADTVRVTIPEGYSVQQIIDLLAEKGVSDKEDLEEAAKNHVYEDYDFVDNENLGDISRLEGYLFPNTYDFYVGEKASSALNRLLKEFNRQMDTEMMELVENSGRSLDEILIIASLIEKETDGTDRQTIASVIYNRLENPSKETAGLLQIDAALVYATGHNELTEEDLNLDSPYNLYKNKGLPPTPICNPGIESIKAALMPAQTDYYYYVLGNDGKHIFSETYAQHQQVIAGLK